MSTPISRFRLPKFTVPFLKLSTANILSNLLVPLAGLIDTAFLGHLSEIHHLGGVAIATILFNYIYWSFGFLRMGTTGLTAQAVGRLKNPEPSVNSSHCADDERSPESESEPIHPTWPQAEIWLVLLRNGVIAIALGLLVLLLQWPLRSLGFALLNATADVQQSGIAFFNGRIWGAPATLLNFVLLGWFLGHGKGRQVLLLSAIANGTNVLLDYLMIVRWGWAGFGAGLATALSQYAMLVVGIGLVLGEVWCNQAGERAKPSEQFKKLRSQLYDPKAFRHLFALNRDILIRTFALVTAFSLFTNFSAALGTEVLAANTLLMQAVTLSAYFIDGLAFATETFAGRFAAAKATQQLRSLLQLSGGLSLFLGITFALSFILYPSTFHLLTHHSTVLTQVQNYTLWLLPILGIGSIAYMLDGYFLGLTAGPSLRNASLLSTGVFFLPLALFAQQQGSVHLLWLALVGLMVGRSLTLGWALHYHGQNWKRLAN